MRRKTFTNRTVTPRNVKEPQTNIDSAPGKCAASASLRVKNLSEETMVNNAVAQRFNHVHLFYDAMPAVITARNFASVPPTVR
jgi:hypothetical protein